MEDTDRYSRRLAVLEAAELVNVGEIVQATITEITSDAIHAIADQGFTVILDLRVAGAFLGGKYKQRRLSPNRVPESNWLYVRDRIRVRLLAKADDGTLTGSLDLEGGGDSDSGQMTVVAATPPTATPSQYDEVLIISDDLDEADALSHFFQDAGYRTGWATDLDEVAAWSDEYVRSLDKTEIRSRSPQMRESLLAIVRLDAEAFKWEEAVTHLLAKISGVDTVLAFRSDLKPAAEEDIHENRKEYRLLGLWHAPSGLARLDAIVQGTSIFNLDPPAEDGLPSDATVISTSEKSVSRFEPRYSRPATDIREVLKSALDTVPSSAHPDAAILFSIHRRSNLVGIVASCGDERIIRGFEKVRHHLHKSPVRDLAIYRQPVETGNAANEKGRYIWFFDAMGGEEKDLSVIGFRPSAPVGDPLSYAGFLFSAKCNAFKSVPRLKETLKTTGKAIELSLLASRMDERAERLRQTAERAADFQYMAHEVRGLLTRGSEVLAERRQERLLQGDGFRDLDAAVGRSVAVMDMMLPTGVPNVGALRHLDEPDTFLAGDSVRSIFELTLQTAAKDHPNLVLVPKEGVARVKGRRLAFECVMRNLILNSWQQILEYSGGEGEVSVQLEVLNNEDSEIRQLRATVSDSGPGIHAAYWDDIFLPGVSTRQAGTGLGLSLSSRVAKQVKGSLALEDSLVYGGTTFSFTMPVFLSD